MDGLAEQVHNAISCALLVSTPQATRDEAYVFLQRVRDAASETWQPCLSLFLERTAQGEAYRWTAEERMFGIQVLGDR